VTDHSIWVCEFARALESPACLLVYGEPGARELPFSFTVVQSDRHTILVDSGFLNEGFSGELGGIDGITMWTHPREVLSRLGITPAEVDAIVITHAHYDHLGDVRAYPNAVVFIQRRELEKWSWALGLPAEMQWLKDGVNGDDLTGARELLDEGRLRPVEGRVDEVFPGIALEPDFDTHTYGHQHVVVDNEGDGRWILPGDAVYTYANLVGLDGSGRYVPIGYATGSQENSVMAIDAMMRAVGRDTDRILPGHETQLWARHRSRAFDDGMRIAEVTVRPGGDRRIERVEGEA
jgi:N-acyl homoserine lactone hydrolase